LPVWVAGQSRQQSKYTPLLDKGEGSQIFTFRKEPPKSVVKIKNEGFINGLDDLSNAQGKVGYIWNGESFFLFLLRAVHVKKVIFRWRETFNNNNFFWMRPLKISLLIIFAVIA